MKITWKKDKKKFQLLFFIGLVVFIVSALNSTNYRTEINNNNNNFREVINPKLATPNVTILSPANLKSYELSASIEINASITYGNIIDVKAMIVNSSNPFNITMDEIAGNWTCTWSNTSSYDPGFYNITIWAKDDNGDINQTQYITVKLEDTTVPSVNIISPADLSSYELPLTVEINATVSDIPSSTLTVMAMIVNGSDPFNITMDEIAGNWTCTWINTSAYDPGFYNISIWAQDESGNVNQTQYITIKLEDSTAPSVNIVSPADLSSYELPLTVEINATVSDIPSSTLTVMAMIVNGSDPFNIAMNEIAGKWTYIWSNTSAYDPGYYNITIWAQDESGNVNQTQYITVKLEDTTAPSVTGITPIDGSTVNILNNVEINATVSDIPPSTLTVMAMIVNGSDPFNIAMNEIAGKWTYIWSNTSDYAPGFYNITIWAQDESGNVNQTEYVTIRLEDTTIPSVIIVSPADLSSYELPLTVEINATVSDIFSSTLSVMAMIVNGSDPFNIAMSEIAGKWTYTWSNTSAYDPGYYNITIRAQDESGNVNQTQYITVKLEDTTAPSVTGIKPIDGSTANIPYSLEINATVSDIPSSTLTVMAMIVNGSDPFNLLMSEIAGTYTCTWSNTSAYDPGYYNITIWAQDESGNMNQTQFVTIKFIILIPPNVTILSPSDGSSFNVPVLVEINASITHSFSNISEAKAMFVNASTPFNLTMTEIAGNWTCTWTNTSYYDPSFYKIFIWAIDENGNVNQTQFINIRLRDIDPPSVTGITPADLSSYDLPATFDINATVSDIPSSTLTVMAMIVNGSDPFNLIMNEIAGTYTCTWSNTSAYDPGYYNITIWAQDESGNVNQTEYFTIRLRDTSAPSVNILTPADGSSFEPPINMSIEINATIIDAFTNISNVKAMINASSAFNLTMNNIAGRWTCMWNNISDVSYIQGTYRITIWAIDSEGNVNQTEHVDIILIKDLTSPTINFINPSENATIITNIYNITVETDDINQPDAGNVTIAIYNGSKTLEFNATMNQLPSNRWYFEWMNISLYDFGDFTTYYFKIAAIDSSYYQNIYITDFWNITFKEDTEPPTFSYPALTNNSEITSSDAFEILIDIIDDFSPPANGSVYLNISWNPTETYTMENIHNNTWRFNWANISDYANGVYTITIWGNDSSLHGNNFSITFIFTLNIAAGGGPSPGGFDLIEFLLSPLGLMIIGGIAIGAIVLTVAMSRRKGSREGEIERISVLTGKNLCEICEHFEHDSQFCRKFLVMKKEGQYDYCKGFKEYKLKKEDEIVPKLEELSEEEKLALLEPLKDTLCISCQHVDIQTRLCKKFMSYAQVRKGAFCKGYRVIQETPEKEKGRKDKVKVPSVKLMGQQMCTVCIHYEPDTGFCKKFLTFKRLKPNEVCKGFKRDKDKNLSFIETTPSNELKSEDTPSSKDERIDKIVGMIGKEDDAPAKSADERMKVPPGQAIARNLCSSCDHFEAESGFCKKYLTYKQLRPGEICKGYKKNK